MKKTIITLFIIFGAGALFWYYQQANPSTNNDRASIAPPARNNQNDSNQAIPEMSNNYVDYSPALVDSELAAGKKVVLFFHASWCPTCRAAEKEILSRINEVPENVVIVKTDYDSNNDLKEKYGVTYQHTFVQLDESLNEITKWNGGGLDAIIDRIK